MALYPPHTTSPSLFEQRPMTTTELRQFNEVFDQLNAQPYTAIRVERYGDVGAYLISPKLMTMCELAAQGSVRVFQLPVDLGPNQGETSYKHVIATELPMSDAPYQRWDVLVDSMHYTLSVFGEVAEEKRLRPDAHQVIWRHHADVARAVLAAFPWTAQHSQTCGKAQRDVLGNTTGVRALIRHALDTLSISEERLSIEHPRDGDMPVGPKRFTLIDELVSWLEDMGEEEFDANVMRGAGPGGGMSLGSANENFREIALELLSASHYDALSEAGFNVEELEEWR